MNLPFPQSLLQSLQNNSEISAVTVEFRTCQSLDLFYAHINPPTIIQTHNVILRLQASVRSYAHCWPAKLKLNNASNWADFHDYIARATQRTVATTCRGAT